MNYGGKKTVRQTRFIIFYRIFPPPLPQNKIFGGGEGEFSWFLNKHGGRSLPFFRHFFKLFFKAKLRLEMAAEHDKHMVHKDLEAKDEEMEQLRFNMQKKVKRYIK